MELLVQEGYVSLKSLFVRFQFWLTVYFIIGSSVTEDTELDMTTDKNNIGGFNVCVW